MRAVYGSVDGDKRNHGEWTADENERAWTLTRLVEDKRWDADAALRVRGSPSGTEFELRIRVERGEGQKRPRRFDCFVIPLSDETENHVFEEVTVSRCAAFFCGETRSGPHSGVFGRISADFAQATCSIPRLKG